jgi:hypothetical protein
MVAYSCFNFASLISEPPVELPAMLRVFSSTKFVESDQSFSQLCEKACVFPGFDPARFLNRREF